MRCSLLALSSYLDGELPSERATELEAHLVGCSRCSTALGYLREEAQRIAGLTRVHVEEPAVREMFALVGFTGEHEEVHQSPSMWQIERVPRDAVATWPDREPSRGLPWTPRPAALTAEYEPPALVSESNNHDANDVERDEAIDNERETAITPEPSEAIAAEHDAVESASVPPYESVDIPAPPMPPPMPVGAERMGTPRRLLNRMRDSVAVRLALMRGGSERDLDDSVQIVSGAGASSWQGRPVHRSYMERMEGRIRPEMPTGSIANGDDVQQEDREEEAIGRVMPHAPTAIPEPVPAGISAIDAPPVEPHEIPAGDVPPMHQPDVTGTVQSPIQPSAQAQQRADESTEPQHSPGRHMRTVTRGQGAGSRWSSFGQLSGAVAHRTGAQRGPAGVDRRLWIVGGVVVLLMVVGILVGKSTTPLPASTVSHPSAAPSLAPRASATAAPPTAAPTPVPTPTPPPSGPQNLTDQVTLGTGGSGFSVGGIRYSAHGPTGAYRIVFDLSGGAAGSPNAVMGFGTPTTFYVEFAGVIPAGAPAAPSPGLISSVKLLQPSPIPGKVVYEFTLTRNANFIANYLAGPRLVIDLK